MSDNHLGCYGSMERLQKCIDDLKEITEGEILANSTILHCAMRYALGRKTYVVSDVAEKIILSAKYMTSHNRQMFIKEIMEAINNDEAGMEMDVKEWVKAIKTLREEEKNDTKKV